VRTDVGHSRTGRAAICRWDSEISIVTTTRVSTMGAARGMGPPTVAEASIAPHLGQSGRRARRWRSVGVCAAMENFAPLSGILLRLGEVQRAG